MRDYKYLYVFMITFAVFMQGCAKKEAPARKEEAQAPQGQAETAAAPQGEAAEYTETMQAPSEEKTLFGFESGTDGFEIPGWAEETSDCVGKSISLSKSYASEGKQSLCLTADFPGRIWTGALIELEQYFDFTPWTQLACDIYIPPSAPAGLRGKIVLTIGEDWRWTEMVSNVPVNPGEWTTIRVSLAPGTGMWKRTEVTDEFRADIRKIVIRVESNKRPTYSGPIYIDNVRVGR